MCMVSGSPANEQAMPMVEAGLLIASKASEPMPLSAGNLPEIVIAPLNHAKARLPIHSSINALTKMTVEAALPAPMKAPPAMCVSLSNAQVTVSVPRMLLKALLSMRVKDRQASPVNLTSPT